MAGTQKCPYCGAGWAGKTVSASHVSACAKKSAGARQPVGAAPGVPAGYTAEADTPVVDYDSMHSLLTTRENPSPLAEAPGDTFDPSTRHNVPPQTEVVTGFGDDYRISAPVIDYDVPDTENTATSLITRSLNGDVEWMDDVDEIVDDLVDEARNTNDPAVREECIQTAAGVMVAHSYATTAMAMSARHDGEDPYEGWDPEDRDQAGKQEAMIRHDSEAAKQGTPVKDWHSTRVFMEVARRSVDGTL